MAKLALKIQGMDCAEEVAILKAELARLPGVGSLAFDVLNRKMTVDFVEAKVSSDDLMHAVAKTGMRSEPWENPRPGTPADESKVFQLGNTALAAMSGGFVAAGFVTHLIVGGWRAALGGDEGGAVPIAAKLLYLSAIVVGAWNVAPKAWRALRRLRPDMNLLMFVAVIGAVAIGEFAEAAMVAFLFAWSLALESWSVQRARSSIAALMSIAPSEARVIDADGRESMKDVAQVEIGSRLAVLPGDRFPLDGKVVKGETTVDQAPITGESALIPKLPGSEVFAGTINQDGAVEIETTKAPQDTTMARIIQMVGDAQSKRSPSEQWVERFARYYTPGVMVLALAVMTLPPIFVGEWLRWIYQGLVLLLIACPCALVISTPVSIVAAIATAARRGVLIKGGPYVEIPASIKAIALDKTGTLTEGQPQVRSIVPLSGHTEEEVLAIAAAIEARSEHPLARAIVREAKSRGIQTTAASDFQAIKGKGATATVNGTAVWLGSHRLLEERGQESPEMHAHLERMEADGSSAVVLGKDIHVCGIIALGDRIRPIAREAVEAMRQAGVLKIVMLTGDNRGTAEAIGKAANVDEIRAELLPQDKVAAIQDLVRRYGKVAMIGDGVNDAPAMAQASLGIAMGAIGTDAALETADIALMGDDLTAVSWLIRHSHRTLRIIRQNIWTSLAVKAIFVVLTVSGHASLWTAIAADMGASLLVISNGLRLLKRA